MDDLKFYLMSWLRNLRFVTVIAAFLGVNFFVVTKAEAVETVEVGRKAAAKYLAPDAEDQSKNVESPRKRQSGENFLMLHLGTFQNTEAFKWKGDDKRTDVGSANYGVTYLYDEFGRGMDLSIRADFIEFKVDDVRPFKLSLMPLVTFPQVSTGFPLYFGIGTGLGIFFRQVEQESSLSFDYQLLIGVRFVNVVNTMGFFIEYGMKNHLQLLSDGQVNGNAISAGVNFSF